LDSAAVQGSADKAAEGQHKSKSIGDAVNDKFSGNTVKAAESKHKSKSVGNSDGSTKFIDIPEEFEPDSSR
jgi:hypothetical protein